MSDTPTAAPATTLLSLVRGDRTVLTAGAFALAATAFTAVSPPPWLGRIPQAIGDIASGARQQLEQDAASARGQLDQATSELAKATEAAAAKDQTIATLQAETSAARTQLEQAAGQAEALTRAKADLAAGSARMAELEGERQQFQGQLDALQSKLASAADSLATAERTLATRTEALAARDATIEEQRRLLSTTSADLQAQEATMIRLTAELQRARTAAQRDATTRLLESEQAVATLEDTVAEQTRTMQRLRQQLDQGAARVRELESERAQQAEAVANLEATRVSLMKRLVESESRMALAQLEQKSITEERDKMTSDLAAAQLAVSQANSKYSAAVQEQKTLSELVAQRQAEVERLQAANETAGAKTAELESALAAASTAREQAAQELTARQEELKQANDRTALLSRQSQALGGEVLRLGAVLHAAEQALRRQVELATQQRGQLEAALAGTAGQLAKYRSEFFTRLGAVVGGRDDVQVVGDRFVVQAEILFDSGSAELGEEGKAELAKVARTILDVAPMIPNGVGWVLQIDGHTDNVPIHTIAFASNWDLSTARAISVVEFLTSQGVPPEHLAATGFGEFQPIATGDDPESRRRNRRIELKLTDR